VQGLIYGGDFWVHLRKRFGKEDLGGTNLREEKWGPARAMRATDKPAERRENRGPRKNQGRGT